MYILPTLDKLKAQSVPNDTASALAIAQDWLDKFLKTKNVENLFLEDSFWRDILALTSDTRTFIGSSKIKALLDARGDFIQSSSSSSPQILQDPHNRPVITNIFPDLIFLQFTFGFETPVGTAIGIARLVPGESDHGQWRAYTVFTALESLKNVVEKIGAHRETVPVVEPWDDVRQKQIDFADGDPDVLVIGAGHTGLEMAAHLKHLGVDALVVDKNPRIGDNLIQLHTSPSQPGNHPGYDALPYLNFPTSWPVYPNARKATNLPPFPFDKLANFLEAYAETLELSVWTSSFLTSSSWNDSTKSWEVIISRGGGELKGRKMNVKHIVFGTGFGGGVPNMPGVANKDKFKGQVFHSSNFKSAREFRGKKAIVVGACNSGHDIAQDFQRNGVDVTMYQRSSTYVISAKCIAAILGGLYNEESNTEYSDRVNASLPFPVIELLQKRATPALADTVDKELLNNLNKVGFKTNLGPGNAGIFPLLFTKAGGYYIDTGGSQDIIDGKIKLKNGSAIKEFKETGLAFEDGETLEADVIVFATGYGDSKDSIAPVLGKQVVERMTPIWGLDEEGEVNGIWKDTGVEEIKAKLDGTLPPKLERF
ncbi:hypothetical protein D9757_011716 [Collybiopsis confluens]|uniref:Pyridine nucleotide-disulphide oxidoreductase N-terminal domain-containing protein n=1 Tax=Collybiopsis confluens TaxID=2823264 RepID=A0A8H5GDT9_9AGAR|nr:hypothetical protein D9757_011716 [Collybiopsis confluens]